LSVFDVFDGSFIPCTPSDFRPFCPFSTFLTEVLFPARLPTSVFLPVFSVLDGSFSPCSLADFRPLCPFSSFWTEVHLLIACQYHKKMAVYIFLFHGDDDVINSFFSGHKNWMFSVS